MQAENPQHVHFNSPSYRRTCKPECNTFFTATFAAPGAGEGRVTRDASGVTMSRKSGPPAKEHVLIIIPRSMNIKPCVRACVRACARMSVCARKSVVFNAQ